MFTFMKYLFIIAVVLTVSLIGCTSYRSGIAKRQLKEAYIYSFKITYFKQLLFVGFNRTNEIQSLLLKDRSGYGEPILTKEDIYTIDSIVNIDNIKMCQDSVLSLGKIAEGAQGKRVFDYTLSKYNSKYLDSLANVRYKYFIKIYSN